MRRRDPRSINLPGFLPVERTEAVVRPLADDGIESLVHGFDDGARAAADSVFALVFAFGSPTDAVVHDRTEVVRQAGDNPVCFCDPIVVTSAARLDVLVVDGHKLVTVPTLVFVMKAQGMAELVRRHPFPLAPPERSDVDVGADAFLEPDAARIVSGAGVAGKVDILRLSGARNERDVRAGVHPALHRFQDIGLLRRRKPGNVVWDDATRPRLRGFRTSSFVGRIGVGLSPQRQQGQQRGYGQPAEQTTKPKTMQKKETANPGWTRRSRAATK